MDLNCGEGQRNGKAKTRVDLSCNGNATVGTAKQRKRWAGLRNAMEMNGKKRHRKGNAKTRKAKERRRHDTSRLAKEQQRSALTGEAKELHSKDQHCDGMAKKYNVTNSKGMAWRLNAR